MARKLALAAATAASLWIGLAFRLHWSSYHELFAAARERPEATGYDAATVKAFFERTRGDALGDFLRCLKVPWRRDARIRFVSVQDGGGAGRAERGEDGRWRLLIDLDPKTGRPGTMR